MPKTKEITDVREQIVERLRDEGRTLTRLSKKTGIPYGTLVSCLKNKLFLLSQENLDKINEALGTDFSL